MKASPDARDKLKSPPVAELQKTPGSSPDFEALKTRLPNLRICHVMSDQLDWPGERGKVDESLLGRVLAGCDRETRVFLCGPPSMMDLATKALTRQGFCHRRIHTERFSL